MLRWLLGSAVILAVLPAHATTITSTSPAANAKAAARTTNIAATCDSAIESSTVTQSTFTVQGALTGRIAGTYSATGSTFQLDPANDLKPGEAIRVTATDGIEDTGAVALTPRVWGFTAAAGEGTGNFVGHAGLGGGNSEDIALGDLDLDGDLDALIGNAGGEPETVWMNDGSGNFAAHPVTPSFGAENSFAVDLGDLDGDGDLDAVIGNWQPPYYETVWMNDGTGGFSAHPTTPAFGSGDTWGIALGDLDADGDLDVVVANHSFETNTVWLNDGDGNFTANGAFGDGDSLGVSLGDLDDDGDLDAVLSRDGPETVWVNDGSGAFTAHPTTASFGTANTNDVGLGDLDGDGDLDAVSVGDFTDYIFVNDGDGNFTAHPTTPTFEGGAISTAVALGDVDGDGDLDAVVPIYGNVTRVWLNDGDGDLTSGPSFGGSFFRNIVLGDVDGDGDLDAATASCCGGGGVVWLNSEIAVSGASESTTEAGGTATFTVVLLAEPSANVVIDLDSSDPGEATVSPSQLTFTNGDWSTPQTVTITGIDDDVDDGNVAYTIITQPATSTDPLFSGSNASDVSNTNTDDDTAGVTVTPATVTVSESGTTDTFTVALNTQPTGDVVIDVASTDTGEVTVSPPQLTFTTANWSSAQTVTATGVNDALFDGNQATAITVATNTGATADPVYDAIDPGDVSATTLDDDFRVNARSPERNESAAPRNADIQAITVGGDPDAATVTQTTFRVQGDQTGRIAGTYSATDATFELDPSASFKPGELLRMTATSGIESTDDVPLRKHVWEFTSATSTASGALAFHGSFGAGNSTSVALGDLDGDGDVDAIIGNYTFQAEGVWKNDGSGTFTLFSTFGGGNTQGVALGDLDGDGDLDAAAANALEDNTIWLNDGAGTFTQHATTIPSNFSSDVTLGDLDGDGDLDLIVSNNGGQATVWRNNGSAAFSAHPVTPSFATTQPNGIALGDLDGDGDLDAVAANQNHPESVFLNDGNGNFAIHGVTPFFGGGVTWDVALGDLDGDGDLDAVVANGGGETETTWLNDGTASFSAHGTIDDFGGGDSRGVALGDLDGDDDLDAVISNISGAAETVWLNDGTGGFTAHPAVASLAGGDSYGLALADLDGDGALDVVVANAGSEQESVWLNRAVPGITVDPTSGLVTTEAGGTDTFTVVLDSAPVANVAIDLDTSDASEATFSPAQLTFTTSDWSTPQTVTVTGVNDDVDDGNIGYIITTDAAVSTDPLYSGVNAADVTGTNNDNDTAAVLVTPTTVTVQESGTNDTFNVVLATEPTGDVLVSLESLDTGEVTITPFQLTFTTADWDTPQTITATGVDDAIDDGNQLTTISLTMNTGSTMDPLYDPLDPPDVVATTIDDEELHITATAPDRNDPTAARNSNIAFMTNGEVDNATVTQSTFRVQGSLTGRIDGSYSAGQLNPANDLKPGETVRITATSGIESTSDVALTPHVWQFTAAAGAASGAFMAHPTTPSLPGTEPTWDVLLGDLDGDGDLDAIVVNQNEFDETVWVNDGDGNFTAHSSFDSGWYNRVSALGDIDGDGDLDAVLSGADTSATMLNDGTGTFSPHSGTPTFGGSAQSVALGDIDGDGDLDAVLAIFGGPETVWLNDGTGAFSPHPTASFGGQDSYGVLLGDLDADGDLDAVVVNGGDFDHPETVWLNDGGGVFTAHGTTPSFGGGESLRGLLGDLDGDHDLDLVVINNDDVETVWLNSGTGSFSANGSFGPGTTIGATLGDVDGDEDLDVITVNQSDRAEVWLNNNNGTFLAHATVPEFGGGSGDSVALGDLDGDGDLDALLGIFGGADTVWLNRPPAGVNVVQSGGTTVVTEAGATDTFTVVLTSQPTEDVVIAVASTDTGEATVSPAELTFTDENWDTAQTVTVTGVNDVVDDGDQASTITLTLNSTDGLYDAIDPADVSASTTDDDTAGVTVTPTSLTVSESGTSMNFTIVLTSEPTGNVVIDAASLDTSEATVSPAQRTFTSANWNVTQSITVTGVNDPSDDGDQNTTIAVTTNTAATADPLYDAIDPANVTATTSDNDVSGVSVTPLTVSVSETGTTGTFTVVPLTQPSADVVIDVASLDTGEASVSPSQLTFTTANWSAPQTVTVTGVDDALDDGTQTSTIAVTTNTAATLDPLYDPIDPTDVTATTADDDKSVTTTAIASSVNPSTSGQTVTFTATVTSAMPGTIGGTVTFRDGATIIGTGTISAGTASLSIASLTPGSHSMTAQYGGDSNFLGSTSSALTQTVNTSPFGAPPFFTATASSGSQVLMSWGAVSGATSYEVHRSTTAAGPFSLVTTVAGTTAVHNGLAADTSYLYKVRAIGSGGPSAFSAVDEATTIAFTDASLAGVKAKAVHITQLRTAANALRAFAGLAAATFTDPTITVGSTRIKRVHVTELRAAIDAARAAIGLPAISYTDPTITVGSTKIKAAHILDLREGVN